MIKTHTFRKKYYYNLYFFFCFLHREAALTVTLVKGGLELHPGQLRRLSGVVTRLTLLPCIAEAVAAGVAAHLLLPNFSWIWGLTLGYVLLIYTRTLTAIISDSWILKNSKMSI